MCGNFGTLLHDLCTPKVDELLILFVGIFPNHTLLDAKSFERLDPHLVKLVNNSVDEVIATRYFIQLVVVPLIESSSQQL